MELQSKCVLQVVMFFVGSFPLIAFSFRQYSFIANDLTFAVSLALLERTGCNRFKVTQTFVFTKLSTAFVDKHFQFRSG